MIVGHGPSLRNNSFGPLIDSVGFVVRLKTAATDPIHRGVRTDAICSRSADHTPDWLFPECVTWDWLSHWKKHSRHPKPSTGCSAVFCVKQFMPDVKEIVLAGCDYLLRPNPKHPNPQFGHDSSGENAAIRALFKITGIEELDKTHGEVRRD